MQVSSDLFHVLVCLGTQLSKEPSAHSSRLSFHTFHPFRSSRTTFRTDIKQRWLRHCAGALATEQRSPLMLQARRALQGHGMAAALVSCSEGVGKKCLNILRGSQYSIPGVFYLPILLIISLCVALSLFVWLSGGMLLKSPTTSFALPK